ncbi:hypothetical protein [Paenibacillus vini]|uniref:hypothetical protein n=1 Tax=Paenibacillus vini TaxID=1476024 RepID=UPI004032964D
MRNATIDDFEVLDIHRVQACKPNRIRKAGHVHHYRRAADPSGLISLDNSLVYAWRQAEIVGRVEAYACLFYLFCFVCLICIVNDSLL